MSATFPLVDSHVHVANNWYEPVDTLLYHLDANGVDQAVLVQQGGQFNNDYILECARSYSDRLYAVVLVDASHPQAVAQLKALAEQGAHGIRLRPTDRSPGDDPLLIWGQAAALGLPISCAGNVERFLDPAFAQIVESLPNATFIIEHLGSVNLPDGETAPYALRRQVFALARYPNVAIKFHGLGEICPRLEPFPQPFPFDRAYLELFDLAYAAFGAERMLWGSDFPPVSGREGYANALRWPQEHFSTLPAVEQALLFGGTAQRIYGKIGRQEGEY
ncbi:MAG: amidohydrolase [Caldilineaceae bacterium]|nr:amidohydrolase [Caldilineaceae bacterium]